MRSLFLSRVAAMNSKRPHLRKKGAIGILAAFLMIVLLAMTAFTVDMGYLCLVRTDLQTSADAGALAGADALLQARMAALNPDYITAFSNVSSEATQFVELNYVAGKKATLGSGDVVIGYLSNVPGAALNVTGQNGYNAVQVRVRRTANQNGAIPLFFARAIGTRKAESQATATAAFMTDISGFKTPSDSSNLAILPFALNIQAWNLLMAGQGVDHWAYDPAQKQVSHGSDGVKEFDLFPLATGASGNLGTVNLGNPSNSTSDVCRQISEGLSAQDLEYLGGSIAVSQTLNGDTGVSAGFKQALTAIAGQPRIIVLYDLVTGTGGTAKFRVAGFACVRIMDVKLTGSLTNIKAITAQPGTISSKGTIPGSTESSSFVYTTVRLVR
jgi:hypothetical protein